jgi:glutaredoxin
MTYTVLSKANCPYSQAAIKFLRERVNNLVIYTAGKDFELEEFKERYGKDSTFPRIYENRNFIGGYEQLVEYFRA